MQIQKVGRVVVGFDHCQALRAKKSVRLFASEDREQEGQVRVVGVQQIQLAKVQSIVARDDGKISVQLVVRFGKEIAVSIGEDTRELGYSMRSFASRTLL
jgi:hypothetical protein